MMEIKELFFDRETVSRSVDKTTRRVLSRFGAFVRTKSRRSIRPRKRKVSKPGDAPFSKTGLLRKFIFFNYEPDKKNVVVGPIALRNTQGEATENLEHGGTIVRRRRGRTIRTRIEPRPFMKPAFDKELPNLSQMWKDAVR